MPGPDFDDKPAHLLLIGAQVTVDGMVKLEKLLTAFAALALKAEAQAAGADPSPGTASV